MAKNQAQSKGCCGKRLSMTPLAAAIAATIAGAPALAQEPALEEIIVTAQKRAQNLQDVPVSVQVLGNQQLTELKLTNFVDYIQFLPTVSYSTQRPGLAKIYMRGVSSGSDGLHSGSMPSVGVYLDEQPITTINHVLDVHVYDVERIETLAGPQGTFFGASSQSGTMRIITNKPVFGEFEAGASAGVNSVEHGDIGYALEGFVNIPISDYAAVRLVGWHKEDAGYIDNVAGTVTLPGNPTFVHDNSALVKEDINTATTIGMRALLKVDLNENWAVTPGIMFQRQDQEGVWEHDPEDVGDLQVKRFWPEFYDDEWYQASLTLEGDINNLNLVYAGAYLDRNSNRQDDYIGYAHYLQNFYYTYYGSCYHHASTSTVDNYVCTDSNQYITRDESFKRQSHEVRLQSTQDGRFRWMAGVFYQRQEHSFDLRWTAPGMDPLGGDLFGVSTIENDRVHYLTDHDRVDRDAALFGEVEFDLTDNLTVIGGYRRFEFENSLFGFNGYSDRCLDANGIPLYPCKTRGTNLDNIAEGQGNTYKLSFNYNLSDRTMMYFTYSEGFRPGGVQQAVLDTGRLPNYRPDFVNNYEIGWKTTWLSDRLRFNGAVYKLEWDDFQLRYNDYTVTTLSIIQNVGNAETTGTEFDLAFAATDKRRLTLAGAYNKAELGNSFWTSRTDQEAGRPPTAAAGAQMPLVPEIRASATGRQEVSYGALPGYFQAAIAYTDDSWSLLNDVRRQEQSSYTIVNLAAGIFGDAWALDLFIDNATDERAEIQRYHRDHADPLDNLFWDTTIVTNRPRTVGLRYSYKWSD